MLIPKARRWWNTNTRTGRGASPVIGEGESDQVGLEGCDRPGMSDDPPRQIIMVVTEALGMGVLGQWTDYMRP